MSRSYNVAAAAVAEAQLAAAGVEVVQPAQFNARIGGKEIHLAVCRDSEGNMLGLISESATV